ncbi:hypothetical protein EBU94_04035 [bacterium]|nr:hypothetical protein [bacterium]
MKHLKLFNESIIIPDRKKIEKMVEDMSGVRTFDNANRISDEYDVKFIPLFDFKKYLKTEKEKESVPPPMQLWSGGPSVLICYNYYLKKVIIACQESSLSQIIMFPPIVNIIEHEFIHKEQDRRRGDFTKRHLEISPVKGAYLSPEYLNDYDEMMAYAKNIANDIYEMFGFSNTIDKAFKIGFRPSFEGFGRLIYDMKQNLTQENYKKFKKMVYQYLEDLYNRKSKNKETINTKINRK